MRTIDIITSALLIIGGLNWGLVGFFGFDLVKAIFGDMTVLSRIIYILVGVSAIYDIVEWKAIHRRWAVARAT